MKQSSYRKLDPDDAQGAESGKVILFHGFSSAQLHAIVAAYRANSDFPQDVGFAVVTEQSAQRKLGEVVLELQEEARKQGR